LLPNAPKEVNIGGTIIQKTAAAWDETSKTLLIEYPNAPDGVAIDIEY
jgi:hypothetical protein